MPIPIAAIAAGFEIAANAASIIQVGMVMAQDTATPAIENIQDEMSATEVAVNKLGGTWDKVFSNLKNPKSLFAEIRTSLLDLFSAPGKLPLVEALNVGIGYVKSALDEASQIQTQLLNVSAGVANELGITLGQAQSIVDDAIKQTASIAAALPGDTRDYTEIYRQLAPAVAKSFPGNPEQYTKESIELTKGLGVLSVTSGFDPTEVGRQASRFMGGTISFGEARQLQLFDNPALLNAISEEIFKAGLNPELWQTLSNKVRTEIFKRALNKAVPPELIASYEGTAESILATWQTNLFEPTTGLLGVLRKIENLQGRSLFDAYQNILQALDRLAGEAKGFLKKLGIDFDPMEILTRVFDYIAQQIGLLEEVFAGFLKPEDIIKQLQSIPESIGEWVSGFSDWFIKFLQNILTNIDGRQMGRIVAQFLWMFEEIKDKVLKNVDWRKLGQTIAQLQMEQAKMERAIWREEIKMIPTRFGNWIGEIFAGLTLWWSGLTTRIRLEAEYWGNSFLDIFKGIGSWFQGLTNLIPGFGNQQQQQPNPTQPQPQNPGLPVSTPPASLPTPQTPSQSKVISTNTTLNMNVASANLTPEDVSNTVIGKLDDYYKHTFINTYG